MKKVTAILSTLIISSMILASCGSDNANVSSGNRDGKDVMKDAQRAAILECRVLDLMQGDELHEREEALKLREEADLFKKGIEELYTSEADKKKFQQYYEEELAECPYIVR